MRNEELGIFCFGKYLQATIKHQFLRSIVELFDKSKDPSTAANANTDGVGDYISSVSWVKEGNIVAVGDNNGVVELWDVTRSKLMRKMRGHTSRVATLDWNAHILASGKEKWLTPFLGSHFLGWHF